MVTPTHEHIETDWLKKWAHFTPDAVAFSHAESEVAYSYLDLYYLSCRLAAHLRTEFGIGAGDRVAVLATNEIEFIPLFFAVQRLGAMLAPVNFRLIAPEITHILRDSSPKLLIHQKIYSQVLNVVDSGAQPDQVWTFDGEGSLTSFLAGELSNRTSPWVEEFDSGFDDPCMILYTSGTTGAPKGALITNSMIYWNSINTGLRLNLRQDDVSISFAPFYHTGGWNVLVTPFLHRGARTVLMKKFDADRVLKLTKNEGVTIFFAVPTMMDMMSKSKLFAESDFSLVRYAIVGGEPMSLDLIKTWQDRGVPIRQGFGLTEFGPGVFSLNENDAIRKIGSIGFPNFYVDARVVDDSSNDVGINAVGELILRGPVCTPGYWNNPEASLKAIRDGWFYTGDLVRKDEDGYFFVVGRKKDMFISGGENVYPVEIEQALSSHPAIREVAVIGVPDMKWGEVGKAFIALNKGQSLSVEDVLQHCSTRLAKYKIPKHVAFMDALPKGDSGKILKRDLSRVSN